MIFAIGFNRCFSTASADAKINAEAPSFNVDAFAAVMVPSLSKAGLKAGIFSSFTFLYSSSSETIISVCFVFKNSSLLFVQHQQEL